MLTVKKIITGQLDENCYIISNGEQALIVDPGAEHKKIIKVITEMHTTPIAILLTHTHFDHIGALEKIRHHYHIPVYVSAKEQQWLTDPTLNLSSGRSPFFSSEVICQPAEFEFKIGELSIGSFSFKVVPTPGHSPGGVSFIFDEFVICGDALFKNSVGRTDLYEGNYQQLLANIKQYLFTLPDELVVHPGHGDDTTIGIEKKYNPHFN